MSNFPRSEISEEINDLNLKRTLSSSHTIISANIHENNYILSLDGNPPIINVSKVILKDTLDNTDKIIIDVNSMD